MVTTCLHLLPYSSQKKLNRSALIEALTLFDVVLDALINSQLQFFQDEQTAVFQSMVKSKLTLQHYVNYLEEKKRISHQLKASLEKQMIPITLFFEKHELLFPVSALDQYLCVYYCVARQKKQKKLLRYYQEELNNFTRAAIAEVTAEMTDHKKAEAELQIAKKQAESASRAKTEFLENMRHDIRTPLTGMIGFAELIQQEAVNPRVKLYADNLVAATKAFLDFQNDILDMVKVIDSTDAIITETFCLKSLIERVIHLIRPKSILKKLDLSFTYDENLPWIVRGDAKRLFRILLELVTNALKFTEKGSITIGAHVERKKNNQLMVRFDVSDTGIGIPKENQHEIFIRFRRLSASSDGVYEGMGLGLTVVKKFVKELGGKIALNSTLNKGTTFSFFLPLMSVTEHDVLPVEKTLSASQKKFNVRVLLVEDHAMTATVMQLLLQDLGCFVDIATTSKIALQYYREKHYDLVLMDLGLPDNNGFDLANVMKQHDSSTLIVGLTAHVDEKDRLKKGIELDNLLQKPLLKETAIQLLSEVNMKKTAVNSTINTQSSTLSLLLKTIDADQQEITTAFQQKNWSKLYELTHKMLGGLVYCG